MRRTLILFSASLLALAGCTTTTQGNPQPSGSSSSQQSSSSATDQVPDPGVPKVTTPIDTTHFQQVPCDALTSDQVVELLGSGVIPKTEPKAPAGPTCTWNSPRVSQAAVTVIFGSLDHLGLTSVYRAKGTKYPFFRPLDPIEGYPLVAYDGEGDQSSKGRCTVAVGVSDQETFDLHIAQSEENIGKKDPCAAARDVAGKVLANLRKGS